MTPASQALFFLVLAAFAAAGCGHFGNESARSRGPGEDVREGFISVTGGRVWYRVVGASRTGVPLLLLHGGPGASSEYLEPLEALADERPVVFFDQLGGGRSDRPDDPALWTIDRFAEEVSLVRKALELEEVHILGQSWGSMLAVDYMLTQRPVGVRGLVLSGPCLSVSRWMADQKRYLAELPEPMRKTIEEKEASGDFASPEYQEAMEEYYKRHLCILDPWPDCLNRAFEHLSPIVYGYMWGPSEFMATGTLKSFERADRLKEIEASTLFTCGRYDEAAPASTDYYHRMLPGSEMVVFENASHSHHLEQTELYLKTVRDFLRRAERATWHGDS